MRQVVIVGGGFAGIAAARRLSREKGIELTLVTDSENFRYNPALYRVATGYLRQQAIIPIKDLLPKNVKIVIGTATKIDREHRTISTLDGKFLMYDFLIVALGVVTSYFGIKGLEQYAYGIKSSAEITRLHDHLHHQLIDERHLDKNYVIVGGGPTGVELAAGLVSYMKDQARQHKLRRTKVHIELVEAAPRLLPMMRPRTSAVVLKRLKKLGVKVMLDTKVEAESNHLLTANGRAIPTSTVIWTAGVTNHPLFKAKSTVFELSKRGKVIVDQHLRVDKHTYVVGDNAETRFSGLAQVAVKQGHYAAADIAARLDRRKNRPYHSSIPVYVIPVGRNWAVMEWRFLTVKGALISLVRRAADLIGYTDIMGWKKALKIWMHTDDKPKNCKRCAALGIKR